MRERRNLHQRRRSQNQTDHLANLVPHTVRFFHKQKKFVLSEESDY